LESSGRDRLVWTQAGGHTARAAEYVI
jgi:hypothetical protein